MISVTKMLAGASVATWASFVIRALPLFFLPLLISIHMDPVLLAFWLVLITLQGLQSIFEVGFTLSFIRGFSYAMGGADRLRIEVGPPTASGQPPNHALLARTWCMGSVLYLGIALITGIVLILFGGWSGATLMAQLASEEHPWGALAVFAGGAALRSYGGLHLSYLYGVNRIALARWWEAAFCLLAFLAAAGTIVAGGGLLALAVAYQIPLAASVFWNMWLCRQDQAARPGFIRGFRADADILAQLWPSIWRTGLGTAIGAFVLPFAILSYTRELSLEESSALLYFMSIFRPLGQFAQVPFSVIVPRLARLQAEGDIKKQIALVDTAMARTYILYGALTFIVTGFFYFVYPETYFLQIHIWILFGIAGMLERISAMHTQWYATTNHIIFHWLNSIGAVMFLAALYATFDQFRASAFPSGHILHLAFYYLPIAIFMSRRKFRSTFRAELSVAIPILAVFALSLIFVVG